MGSNGETPLWRVYAWYDIRIREEYLVSVSQTTRARAHARESREDARAPDAQDRASAFAPAEEVRADREACSGGRSGASGFTP